MSAITREKKLMLGAGAMVAVLGIWQVVQRGVLGPLRGLDEQITTLESRRAELARIAVDGEKEKKLWEAQVAQTISPDQDAAMNEFRKDIDQLLRRMRLERVTVSQKPAKKPRDHREGFIELPLDISFTANYAQALEFVNAIYNAPYLVKVTSLDMVAKHQPARSGKGKRNAVEASPDGPDLDVTVRVETLVLPDVEGVKHEPMQDIATRRDPPLLPEAHYNDLRKRNVFAAYVPPPPPTPPPPVVTSPEDTPVVKEDRPPRVAAVDPRRDADQKRLVGVTSMNGRYIAYVTDDSRLDIPPREYDEGADIDDGRLVFVHPTGLIVQVSEPAPRRYYFYPLGTTWADREELSGDEPGHLSAIIEYRAARFGKKPSEESPDGPAAEASDGSDT